MCHTRSTRKRPRSASRESHVRPISSPLQSDSSDDSDDSVSLFIINTEDHKDEFDVSSDSDCDGSISHFILDSEDDNKEIDVSSDSDGGGSISQFIYDSDEDKQIDFGSDCDTSFESPVSSIDSWPSSPTVKRPRTELDTPAAQDDTSDGDDEGDAGDNAMEIAAQDKCIANQASALVAHRDEIVAAILTIVSALGLTKETLHVCVDLLDRYLLARSANEEPPRLETLSIACLWIAVKFIETPDTIAKKRIKQILKRRRLSGNWTWQEILRQEAEILKVLNFRLMAPTVLNVLQHKIHNDGRELSTEQIQLAHYFADLLLLKNRANEFAKELLVEAIWFIVTGHQIADVQAPLLAPVVILFLAHRDNINPKHAVFKTWFALRCKYGPSLQAPWQVPFDPKCECRVCEHNGELSIATTLKPSKKLKSQPSQSAAPYAQAA